jgi:O-antigen ligase
VTFQAELLIPAAFFIYVCSSAVRSYPQHNVKEELGFQVPMFLLFLVASQTVTTTNLSFLQYAVWSVLLLNGALGFLQSIGKDPFIPARFKREGTSNDPVGTIGNTNWLGAYLVSALWLCAMSGGTYDRALCMVIGISALFFIMIGISKAGILAIITSAVFFIGMDAWFTGAQYSAIAIFGAFLFLLLGFLVFVIVRWDYFWRSPIDQEKSSPMLATLRYRLCYWASAWNLIKQRPVFGWGLQAYRREVYDAQGRLEDRSPGFLDPKRYLSPQPRHAHNDFIEHTVEFGAVGLSLFLLFVASVYTIGLKYITEGGNQMVMLCLLSGVTAMLIEAVFFFPLRIPSSSMMFWFQCGAVFSLSNGLSPWSWDWGVWTFAVLLAISISAAIEVWWGDVAAAWHFRKFTWSKDQETREYHILKALEYRPFYGQYRSRAAMCFMNTNPLGARWHSMKALEHYDGTATKFGLYYNAALVRLRAGVMDDEVAAMLRVSHWLNPYFPFTNSLIQEIEELRKKGTQ